MPADYPFAHPAARFVTKILHPNVDKENGAVSLDMLDNQWSPAMTVSKLVVAIVSLMHEPNFDSPVAPDLARLRRDDPSGYERTVRDFTQKHAK